MPPLCSTSSSVLPSSLTSSWSPSNDHCPGEGDVHHQPQDWKVPGCHCQSVERDCGQLDPHGSWILCSLSLRSGPRASRLETSGPEQLSDLP